jgi:hypothetical protein
MRNAARTILGGVLLSALPVRELGSELQASQCDLHLAATAELQEFAFYAALHLRNSRVLADAEAADIRFARRPEGRRHLRRQFKVFCCNGHADRTKQKTGRENTSNAHYSSHSFLTWEVISMGTPFMKDKSGPQ